MYKKYVQYKCRKKIHYTNETFVCSDATGCCLKYKSVDRILAQGVQLSPSLPYIIFYKCFFTQLVT